MRSSLFALPLVLLLRTAYASECSVSSWGGWSACFGDCNFGQQVRNRDVIKPPMPEVSSRGAHLVPICPHLYETRFCIPTMCIPTTFAPKTVHRWHASTKVFNSFWPSVKAAKEAEDFLSRGEDISVPSHSAFQQNGRSTFDEFFPTLMTATENSAQGQSHTADPFVSLQHRYRGRIEPQEHFTLRGVPISTRTPTLQDHLQMFATLSHKHQDKSFKHHKTDEFRKFFGWSGQRATLPTSASSSSSSSSSSSTTTTSTTESPSTENTTMAEPFGEGSFQDITAATKAPNMKQVEIMLSTTIQTPVDNETFTTEATELPKEPTTRGMWLREEHYVPNTRQHATEITKQLYITGQIKQAAVAVPDDRMDKPNEECKENARCCQIVRDLCPDGTPPIYVKRYYRPLNSKECVPYRYPRCDKATEMAEQPIQYSQNCEDLCFPTAEKAISPLFVLSAEV